MHATFALFLFENEQETIGARIGASAFCILRPPACCLFGVYHILAPHFLVNFALNRNKS
jgi:hypothetical protein